MISPLAKELSLIIFSEHFFMHNLSKTALGFLFKGSNALAIIIILKEGH